jgi:hypothetical protein
MVVQYIAVGRLLIDMNEIFIYYYQEVDLPGLKPNCRRVALSQLSAAASGLVAL